jgi:glycosyltransferase involved in cell wall biosynthesis
VNDDVVKISIVVPIYNAEKYLPQCLDSVIGQTLGEIQIILVNDGSTDSSGRICQQYAKNDARIAYIEKSNGGLASARRAGLEISTGQYVGFVDSDDWIELKMYEKMYTVAEEHSADIVLCDSIFNESKNRSANLTPGNYSRERIETEIFPHVLASFGTKGDNDRIRWSNCVRLYRKSLIDEHEINFDDRFRRCQDLPFTFECTIHANGFYYLGDEYLYHNRPVVDSLSIGYTDQMWELLKPLMRYLDDIVKSFAIYDFSSQMTLRAFMFAMNCIENEAKPNNKRGVAKRLRAVREIMRDEYTRGLVGRLDTNRLSRLYKLYFHALKYGLPVPAYLIAYYRLRHLRRRYDVESIATS